MWLWYNHFKLMICPSCWSTQLLATLAQAARSERFPPLPARIRRFFLDLGSVIYFFVSYKTCLIIL